MSVKDSGVLIESSLYLDEAIDYILTNCQYMAETD